MTVVLATQHSGMNRTAISSGQIAGGITEDPNAAATMIGLTQGAIDTKASASVVKAADDILGTLIDIRLNNQKQPCHRAIHSITFLLTSIE